MVDRLVAIIRHCARCSSNNLSNDLVNTLFASDESFTNINIDGVTYNGSTSVRNLIFDAGMMQIGVVKTTTNGAVWGTYVEGNNFLIRKKNTSTNVWLGWKKL